MKTQDTIDKCLNCNNSRVIIIPQGLTAKASFCPICHSICPMCKGDGLIFEVDQYGRDFAKKCDCQELTYKIALFNNARIPSQFYDVTFDNFQTFNNRSLSDALHTTKFFFKELKKQDQAHNSRRGLLFMGGVGVGKTRLVCTMIRAFTLKYGIPCLFQEFSSLLSEIKSGYDKGLSESVVLEKINNVEILIIDELGKGRKSEWEITILDTIVSNRYNMQKCTIFTTNYTDKAQTSYQNTSIPQGGGGDQKEREKRETLQQRVYPRIYSRLKGMCNFVEIRADDFRHPDAEIALNQMGG